jgi:hypothetical protein
MGSPWPAPASDEQIGDGRGPNYALRRVVVLVVVVALIGAGAASLLRRGGDDQNGGGTAGTQWNTVVLQNAKSGELTLTDATGQEVDSFPTDMMGLLDVGLPGRLVVGIAGQAATDGLGVVDLHDGTVTQLAVQSDGISRLDTSAYLLASGGPKDPLGLVDVSAGKVIDLLALVDSDSPIVNPSLVRIDPEHSHIAFTELSDLETVLVDLDTYKSVSLAGSLVDIASGSVLTITNRGQTSLVDLYGFDGKRVGTVETDAAAGALLLDDTSALVVTRAGGVVSVDFGKESVDELGSVADQLQGTATTSDGTTATDGTSTANDGAVELVRAVVPVLDRTRLLLVGKAGVVIIDLKGAVIAADRLVDPVVPTNITSADRCVVLGAVDAEQTLWDTSAGSRIKTFDPGFVAGRSADGCTITYTEQPAGASSGGQQQTRLVGRDVDRSVDGQLGAVAPDGTAAIAQNADGAFVIDAASGDRVDLKVDTLFAVFTDR